MGPKICRKKFENRFINTIFILKNVFGQGILHVKNQTKGSNYCPRKLFEYGLFSQEHVRVTINGTRNLLVALKSEYG